MKAEQLAEAIGCSLLTADRWADALTAAMAEYEINTPARQAAFLAQLGHESLSLHYDHELWGNTPQQLRYEGRADLGNNIAGDGFKYRGEGPIQITGRKNFALMGHILGLDLLTHPELLREPVNGARSAACWWQDHGCNELADAGLFDKITATINLGNANANIARANGVEDRRDRWVKAKAVLT